MIPARQTSTTTAFVLPDANSLFPSSLRTSGVYGCIRHLLLHFYSFPVPTFLYPFCNLFPFIFVIIYFPRLYRTGHVKYWSISPIRTRHHRSSTKANKHNKGEEDESGEATGDLSIHPSINHLSIHLSCLCISTHIRVYTVTISVCAYHSLSLSIVISLSWTNIYILLYMYLYRRRHEHLLTHRWKKRDKTKCKIQ